MSSVNPVFHSLGFGQDHDYNSANMPVQQVYNNRQCGFNCVCCARMLLGNYCPCAFPMDKRNIRTQYYAGKFHKGFTIIFLLYLVFLNTNIHITL